MAWAAEKRRRIADGEVAAVSSVGPLAATKEERENKLKIKFVRLAAETEYPLNPRVQLPRDLQDVVDWLAARTPEQVNCEREAIMCQIEKIAAAMWKSGKCEAWYGSSDAHIRQVSEEVCGPLLQHLAAACQYHDAACVDFFRFGALLLGLLPKSGNGRELQKPTTVVSRAVFTNRRQRNAKILSKAAKEGLHAAEMLRKCREAVKLGRMSGPFQPQELDLDTVVLSTRFGVSQGFRDGVEKIRGIDHMTESMVNGSTTPQEKLSVENLDLWMELARSIKLSTKASLVALKGDIDSAYSRIPLDPTHREFAYIVFSAEGSVQIFRHNSCPFGAIGAVHGWDRPGNLLCAILRRVLKLPLLRYVDDLHGVERSQSVQHAEEIMARAIRCLLGPTAISQRKLAHGNPLVILGVNITIEESGVRFRPEQEKVVKWRSRIESALQSRTLSSGEASKLAGALQWGAQYIFRRLGRAMLRPIFQQIKRRTSAVTPELELALRCETIEWHKEAKPPLYMLCDARSTPPRVAAVLFDGGSKLFFDEEPPSAMLKNFKQRGDNQIMSLELLSIAYGISSFADNLRGRDVVIFSDNTAAEAATRNGTASAFDQAAVVHSIWLQLVELRCGAWIERVPTADNLADLPSREEYKLLEHLGAVRVKPSCPALWFDTLARAEQLSA